MRYLVTGASGFVGRHLLHALAARQSQAAGVSLDPAPGAVPFSAWLQCDFTQNLDALRVFMDEFAPQAVIHLAATSFEPLAASQPWNAIQNNLLVTLNLLTACRQLSTQATIVIVSSSAVYGQNPAQMPLTEQHQPAPLTIYGVSKLAVEMLAMQHQRAYNLQTVVVRPFNLTGPGEHASFVTSAFARQIALIEAGKQPSVIKVGNLTSARDFTDVRDAVSALATLAEWGQPGEVYNLCSGVSVTIGDLLQQLLRSSRSTIDVRPDPDLVRPVEIRTQQGDPTKLKRATGWQPRYALGQMLADVLDDWRTRVQKMEV